MAAPECLANRYELRGLLGRGGMGEVHDGWDRRLDRRVAVKLLNPELAAQDEVRTRFQAEAQAAARLANPKVVGVFDTGESDGIPYIVMERLPGRTLADEIAGGPLGQARVREILLDMLEALAAAHDAGILHRDIKPSNVLLTEEGTAKIADFGIAKTAGLDLTQTGQFVGTAGYLSPERLNGLPAGPESDLYSTGVVGYEALSGTKPFEADTPLGLIRAIADDPTPSIRSRLPDLDENLASAIDCAIQRRPEDRFHSAREMMAALSPTGAVPGAAPAGATVASARPAGGTQILPPAGSPPWYRTPAARWAALAGAVLALVILFRLVGAGDGQPPEATRPEIPPAGTEASDRLGPGEARPISGVSRVEFLGPGTLILEQTGAGESLTVQAPPDLLARIRTDVAGGRLIIGMNQAPQSQVGSVVYRVRVSELTEIRAAGGGTIQATGLSTESLTVDNAGSTDIELSGEAGSLSVTLNGSGNLDAAQLHAGRVTAELNGSGDAVVAASERLAAELSGSGNLEYLGDPEVTQRAAGSGRVSRSR